MTYPQMSVLSTARLGLPYENFPYMVISLTEGDPRGRLSLSDVYCALEECIDRGWLKVGGWMETTAGDRECICLTNTGWRLMNRLTPMAKMVSW